MTIIKLTIAIVIMQLVYNKVILGEMYEQHCYGTIATINAINPIKSAFNQGNIIWGF